MIETLAFYKCIENAINTTKIQPLTKQEIAFEISSIVNELYAKLDAHYRDFIVDKIKDEIKYQVVESDGRQDFTKNLTSHELDIHKLLEAGYANILVEMIDGTFSLRITKKGEPLVHEDKNPHEQILEHDRKKARLLDPADPFLIEVGISDKNGIIKPTRQDKYIQVEEFLRILVPTIEDAIKSGKGIPVVIVNFIAMLELSREALVEITQAEPYAPIYVRLAYTPVA